MEEERTPVWECDWVWLTAGVLYSLVGVVMLVGVYHFKYGLPTGSYEEVVQAHGSMDMVQAAGFIAISVVGGLVARLRRVKETLAFWMVTSLLVHAGGILVSTQVTAWEGALLATASNWWWYSIMGLSIAGYVVNQLDLFRGRSTRDQ